LNICHGALFRPGPLTTLIDDFLTLFGPDRPKLNSWIKRLKVRVTHLPPQENAAGEMEQPIKTIWGVARPGDGPPDSPAKVKDIASSADNVKFCLKTDDKPDGEYVSVTDYFRRSELFIFSLRCEMPAANRANQDTIAPSDDHRTFQL
jgi:hypothetical protein